MFDRNSIFSLPPDADVEVAVFQRMWIKAKGKQCTTRASLYQEMFGDSDCEFNIANFTTSSATTPPFFASSSQVSLSTAMGFFSQESLQYAGIYRSLTQLGTTLSSLSPDVLAHKRLGHLVHLQQLRYLFSDACQYLDNEMKVLLEGLKKEMGGEEGNEKVDDTSDESYDESASDSE